jgi:hypothetical protein
MKIQKNFKSVALTGTLLIALAGCSAMTPEEAEAKFKSIASASCESALSVGSVEKSELAEGFTLVLVPKTQAYKDFSAAYFQPDDTYELIWEVDAFSACGASMSYDLAEEAGQESDLEVTFNSDLQQYETFQDLGEFGDSHLRYGITDGKISSVVDLNSETDSLRTIKYGNLTSEELEIIKTAADRFLSE